MASGRAWCAIIIKALSMFPLERQFLRLSGVFFLLAFLSIKESGQGILIVHARQILRLLCKC